MTPAAGRSYRRLAATTAVLFGGFFLLQSSWRGFEAQASVAVLHALGIDGVRVVLNDSIQVTPATGLPFRAIIKASCSSLAAVLALGCLVLLTPSSTRGRKAFALVAAVTTVVVGNIVRIAASLAAGLVSGRSSLVLFHDWVGSVFSFAYTLGGYVLVLFLLLPSTRQPDPSESTEAVDAVAV